MRISDGTSNTSARVADVISVDEANAGVPGENYEDEASMEMTSDTIAPQNNFTNKQVDEMLVKALSAAEEELDAAAREFWLTATNLLIERNKRREQTDESESDISVQDNKEKEINDKE
eukprot:6887859-Ditylum_brightwellii.AAC.1